jgi:hypothetical protein
MDRIEAEDAVLRRLVRLREEASRCKCDGDCFCAKNLDYAERKIREIKGEK